MTSGKPPDVLDALDLSCRARRGELGPEARRLLDHALESSALIRAAHETGRSFDAANAVRPGDEALILRAASLALGSHRAPLRTRGVRWALGGALALLVASAGAATVLVVARSEQLELARRAPRGTERPSSPPRAASSTVPAPGETNQPAGSLASSPLPTRSAPSSAGTGASATKREKSAASLFLEASAARRAGDFGSARALYAELQARFPGSSEARVSLVSLGKLLASAGKPREAEQAFGAYLRGGGGDLGEEALVGRASALALLGEGGEERRAWQDLLKKYPTSVYRARAERRVDALDSARRSTEP